ncbi:MULTISPECIES: DUF3768 domain-containing protein [Erythrobacter]|jgi:hypothetical protein|uniref:DUF3768 domain-containing protein n=1 Tax=Erythrobacter TaxID=1041 RepID=UPI00082D175C|nr:MULTISPECIES: DUF3768 domain-containing protein [Erythrobacter]
MLTEPIARAEQIAKLNDRARSGFDPSARIMFTRGCLDAFCSGDTPSGLVAQAELIKTMRRHRFEEDAYGERDFGAFTFRGQKIFFKIDCYDLNLEYGSEDPADASITARVVTIMLASEY